MATLDGGGVEGTSVPALDGGSVVDPDQAPPVNAFGVTVDNVRNLATHLGFNTAHSDPDFGPTRTQITNPMIAHWIQLVTESVQARVASLGRFRANTDRWAVITGSARTAITNGAASYLVAAAFPAKAGTNDQTSYSAELWKRYETELGTLIDLGPAFDAEDAAGPESAGGGILPASTYTPPTYPDGSRLFNSDPYNRIGSGWVDPNRMHPTRGGYPGAEIPRPRW